MPPPVISIISKKNTGKTTLLEKLIPELKRRGYRVGIVKHDIHGFEIDHEGRDTWRHKQAGASTVAISCPWKLSLIKDVDQEAGLDAIVARYFDDMDIVLTEGYKQAGKPQIEVFRRQAHARPLHTREENGTLVAVMTDTPLELGVLCLDINDIRALADLIEHRFIKPAADLKADG